LPTGAPHRPEPITTPKEHAVEKTAHVRHPIEWAGAQLQHAWRLRLQQLESPPAALPLPRHITTDDLRASLAAGLHDFLTFRSDVVVLCCIYPVAGAVLWQFATGANLLHMIFPLIAGFALVGPLFATGLYEMSRRQERGEPVTWATAFEPFRSPAIFRIAALGVALLAVFFVWLLAAEMIYRATLGGPPPASLGQFAHEVLFTSGGLAMIVLGIAVGFVFAFGVLCCGVISFPLLLDKNVTVPRAVRTSIAAVRANPRVMALWGLVVAAGLAIGAAPFLVGLIVILPILGHATWHLYRRLIP
jgi:uncharacterized membrane protein